MGFNGRKFVIFYFGLMCSCIVCTDVLLIILVLCGHVGHVAMLTNLCLLEFIIFGKECVAVFVYVQCIPLTNDCIGVLCAKSYIISGILMYPKGAGLKNFGKLRF